ncbi:DUF7282 domain-containing protein [Salinisphaera hydrothermalis]|uniref:DUF7282 domain-containing protein n=1 Tax=Salinisphaera hydrothermalis TaxID=563188 RepID=UPI003341966E
MPSVDTSPQPPGDQVTIPAVVANAPGFIVIHESKANGKPVVPASIGHTAVETGTNKDVVVKLDHPVKAGDKLFAMLHKDTGNKGVYAFGPGSVHVDPPVVVDGHPLVRSFTVADRSGKAAGIIQAPALPGAQAISRRDRVYTADQSSNTVTVIEPATNTVLGTIALGSQRLDGVLGPVDRGEVNVHGLGFSRDGRLLIAVSVTSDTAQIIDTATNKVVQTLRTGRSPHEGFIGPKGKTAWVAVRGENNVEVFDIGSGKLLDRIVTAEGPSKVVFSPDGKRAYVNHLFTNELDVIDVASRRIVKRIAIPKKAGGSADLAVSPDGKEVWLGHPKTGKTTVIDAKSLTVKTVLDTGARTNHPNFVTRNGVDYAYVTVGGENVTKVYRRPSDGGNPVQVDTIKNSGVGPHGIWPSPDNTRLYVVLQKSDALDVIDTATNKVIDTLDVGQDPQALVYVAGAVPAGQPGTSSLSRQGLGERVANLPINTDRIGGNAHGLANIRAEDGLDEVDISARGLPAGKRFDVYASRDGNTEKLMTVTANPGGVVPEALAFTAFFDNYDSVLLVPEGVRP